MLLLLSSLASVTAILFRNIRVSLVEYCLVLNNDLLDEAAFASVTSNSQAGEISSSLGWASF